MSGYAIVFGPCWSCRRLFTFDPERVPSLPIDPASGLPPDLGGDAAAAVKQPICRDCVTRANEARAADGRPLLVVLPGAYLDEG